MTEPRGVGNLWTIIQAHLDKYGVREAAFARTIGSSPQTVNSWKLRGVRALPERRLLEAVADITGTPYPEVLAAALADAAYLDNPDDYGLAANRGEKGVPDADQREDSGDQS